MSSSRLFKQLFQTGGTSVGSGSTSVGNWVCPAGVKWVIITGCGGGGGGGGGASVSSTNSASPLFIWYIAMGGGGGQASITATQVVAVTPGVSYPVSIGQGGAGANNTGFGVYNGAPTGTNQFGGVCFGNAGSQGASSIFGSVVLPGGLGGRRGEIMAPPWAANEITNFVPSDNVTGLNPYGFGAIPGTYNGIPNPPGLLSSPYSADAVALQGAINNATSLVANAALPGLSRIFRANGLGGGGGGGGGGYSNNIYSVGGQGGQGAQGVNGYPFSTGGNSGVYGGGGGGGGGGEGLDYNNTHDGSGGGNGGSGFIEIAWVQ